MKISIEILSIFEICYNFGEKEIDRFKFFPPQKKLQTIFQSKFNDSLISTLISYGQKIRGTFFFISFGNNFLYY